MNIKKISLALLLLTFLMAKLIGQTLPKDLSTIAVYDFFDQQLHQLLQHAQAGGLTDAEIVRSAVSRGLPQNQAVVLGKRINSIRGKQQSGNATANGI